MKWYTCTPVPFKGDHTFFSRDSGAFCKAFQRIGLESRAIMPTPVQEGDDPDLIRTEYANLEDAAWWKSLGIDGLVLYAWGTGKYLPIARAIHDAGIFLVVYMDSSGLFFPWQYWLPIAENMWTRDVFARGKIRGTAFFLLRLLKQHTWNLASRGRRKHLDQGDMVAFPMPAAVKSIQDREWLYGKSIVRKLALIPNPISSTCRYAGEKRNIIMAVGRWDDLLYKRPFLLMATLEQALPRAPHWEAEIYGNIPPSSGNGTAIFRKTSAPASAWPATCPTRSCKRNTPKPESASAPPGPRERTSPPRKRSAPGLPSLVRALRPC
ncbi:hypothetical protein ABFY27_02880 [Akkermansia massiliensis]